MEAKQHLDSVKEEQAEMDLLKALKDDRRAQFEMDNMTEAKIRPTMPEPPGEKGYYVKSLDDTASGKFMKMRNLLDQQRKKMGIPTE